MPGPMHSDWRMLATRWTPLPLHSDKSQPSRYHQPRARWDRAARRALDRPYLDPLAAQTKRQAHLALLDRWLPRLADKSLLKTDLWEEGVAGDELLYSLARRANRAYGVDVSPLVVAGARKRAADLQLPVELLESDVIDLPFPSGAVEAVISTSTLDHLDDAAQLRAALLELRRVLAPEGVLVVTIDNRKNIFDWALRGADSIGLVPFPLGAAPCLDELERLLSDSGFRPDCHDYLVPGPRVLSTLAIRLARALGRKRSDRAVSALLRSFEALGRWNPERMSCFLAVRATAV
jgi:SAM-dependent methyltransferase